MAYLSAHLSDPAQRRRYPDRRPAKAASSRAHLDNPAVWRSAYGEPAAGAKEGREENNLSLFGGGKASQGGTWEKKKRAPKAPAFTGVGWGGYAPKRLVGRVLSLR